MRALLRKDAVWLVFLAVASLLIVLTAGLLLLDLWLRRAKT